MVEQAVHKVGVVSTGNGAIGRGREFASAADEAAYAQQLTAHTVLYSKANTADCGDERQTIRLADGTDEADVLQTRVVPQLFGGLVLPLTKALVAVNHELVRDAPNMQAAYENVCARVTALGYEDGGHAGCGASGSVASSIALALDVSELAAEMALCTPLSADDAQPRASIAQTQTERLQNGFYDTWQPQWHEDFLSQKFPQNFSYLAVDENDHDTHGHHAASLYVITKPDVGFAKNAFIAGTGQEAFAVTVPLMQTLAKQFGNDSAQQRAIELALYEDTIRVGSCLVVPTLPVFA